MVFHQYLWINVFVWALVFCGIIYYQYASMDSSGVIQEIHTKDLVQTRSRAYDGF